MTLESGLCIDAVSHRYDRTPVLHRAGLTVGPGEVHCLLGPSGSGKSTLLRLVAGLETLQEGRIDIDGSVVAGPNIHVRPEDRSIGFVFQDYALFPHLDVRHNVLFGMPKGPKEQRHADALALLDRVGMVDFVDAMPHTLSGGQQQRVALARALARRPVVMLLDEPFSGLDARLRGEVRHTTLEVLRRAGVATLMVTHDPQEALGSSDRVSVIQGGHIVQSGPPDEVYGQSSTPEVAEVFGPVNRLRGTVRGARIHSTAGELPNPGLPEGEVVDLWVRPESVHVHRGAPEGSVPAKGVPAAGVPATITELTPEGGLLRMVLTLGDGSTLEAHDLPRSGWAVGDAVSVTLENVGVQASTGDGPGGR